MLKGRGNAFLTALFVSVIVMLFLLFTCISLVDYGYISYPILYTIIGIAMVSSFVITFIYNKDREPKDGEVASAKAALAGVQMLTSMLDTDARRL